MVSLVKFFTDDEARRGRRLEEGILGRVIRLCCMAFAVILIGAQEANAQFNVSPAPGQVQINTPVNFTFTVNVPSGGTAINTANVFFYQSAASTPSTTIPWCGFTLITWDNGDGTRTKKIHTYGADGSHNAYLTPPYLWTTPAQRTNNFCSLAAEDQVSFIVNSTGTSMTVSVPVTFLQQPAQVYHLYMDENYQAPGNAYANSATQDLGAYPIGAVAGFSLNGTSVSVRIPIRRSGTPS